MEQLLTPSNITFALGIIVIIFNIYHYFKNPQINIEKRESLNEQADAKDKLLAEKDLGTKATILAQKELETRALVLAEQVKNKDTENERRFIEMATRIDSAFSIAQNHINTIETDVKNLTITVNSLTNAITKLGTIIEERNPRQ